MSEWYRMTRPASLPSTEPIERIVYFLKSQGIACAEVVFDGDDLLLDAASDPATVLASYVSVQTPDEKALARMQSYLQVYRDNLDPPGPNQVARTLKTVIAYLLRLDAEMG